MTNLLRRGFPLSFRRGISRSFMWPPTINENYPLWNSFYGGSTESDSGRTTHNGRDEILHQAAREGHTRLVKDLLFTMGEIRLDEAFCLAAQGGHLEMVEYLRSQGASNLNLALYEAADEGHLAVVKYLINEGADDINWALYRAQVSKHSAVVEYLENL